MLTDASGLIPHPDGCARCWWAGLDPVYVAYHDTEWGVPERDGRALYEKLILDGFQAGLSWITILRRREGFRRAFAGFDPEAIARFTEADVARLMQDTGIIRNRAKIVGTIAGARAYLAKRQLPEEEWSRFRLGYAPEGRTALKDALVQKGARPGAPLMPGPRRPYLHGSAPRGRRRARTDGSRRGDR